VEVIIGLILLWWMLTIGNDSIQHKKKLEDLNYKLAGQEEELEGLKDEVEGTKNEDDYDLESYESDHSYESTIEDSEVEFSEVELTMDETILCEECGHDAQQDMKFCIKCGNKLVVPCEQCSFVSPQGAEFCGQCGEATEIHQEKLRIEEERREKLRLEEEEEKKRNSYF